MLELRKKGDKYWLFIDGEIGEFSPSKFTINLLNNVITIVYENGLKSKNYNVIDCEIYDLGATSPFTTSSGNAFMEKLEELNCPCFQKNENTFNISADWGQITGNLSDQTDLQNALNLKLDKVSTVDVEKVYIKNADGTQGMKPTSELGGNYDLGNWLVNRFVNNNVIQPHLLGSAVNGGNINMGISSNSGSFKTMSGVSISSGTNANGGYRFTTPYSQFIAIEGLCAYGTFYIPQDSRDNFIQLGFVASQLGGNSISKSCITINTNTATLVTQDDAAVGDPSTVSASVVLSAGTSPITYYTFLVEFLSATSVRARIKNTLTNTIVFDETNSTNVPQSNQRFGAHVLASIVTAGSSASPSTIQEFSYGMKPDFLNNF